MAIIQATFSTLQVVVSFYNATVFLWVYFKNTVKCTKKIEACVVPEKPKIWVNNTTKTRAQDTPRNNNNDNNTTNKRKLAQTNRKRKKGGPPIDSPWRVQKRLEIRPWCESVAVSVVRNAACMLPSARALTQ